MVNKFFSLVFLLLITSVKCRNLKICKIKDQECVGVYNSNHKYTVECHNAKCTGQYSFFCDKDHCSTNEQSCHNYLLLTYFIKSIENTRLYDEMKEQISVIENISECPNLAIKLKYSDFCLRKTEICKKKILVAMRSGVVKFHRKVDCKCPHSHSYVCDKEYCTLNQKVCDVIINFGTRLNTTHFKTCY